MQICFLKKQADLKTNNTRRFVLMITYVNPKILFLLMVSEYFQKSVKLLANELKRYITIS